MTCPDCGASAPADATWCGQCHRSFAVASAPQRMVPAAAAPTIQPVHSRWRGGATSFGPVGRISWTVAVLLVAVFALVTGSLFLMVIWYLFVGPMILRSVWHRARIR